MDNVRLLGLDYGEKRIGVAVSDPLRLTAQPLSFLANDPTFDGALTDLCDRWDIREIVVGLPKKLDGTESVSTQKAREFADRVQTTTGKPVILRDERLSTVAVTRVLIDADLSRKKRKTVVDSQSAAFVLQGYLDFLRVTATRADRLDNS